MNEKDKKAMRDKMIEIAEAGDPEAGYSNVGDPRDGVTITYSKLLSECNLDKRYAPNEISPILGSISREEQMVGRPLLSSVVVKADTNRPGDGFFKEFVGKEYPEKDEIEFCDARLKETRTHWPE